MQDERGKLTRDLIHVREHEKQTLRCGESRTQSPRLKCSVDRPRGASLALHFDDGRHCTPEIFQTGRSPCISPFPHRRGRRDGVNRNHLVKLIGNARGRFVTIDHVKFFGFHSTLFLVYDNRSSAFGTPGRLTGKRLPPEERRLSITVRPTLVVASVAPISAMDFGFNIAWRIGLRSSTGLGGFAAWGLTELLMLSRG